MKYSNSATYRVYFKRAHYYYIRTYFLENYFETCSNENPVDQDEDDTDLEEFDEEIDQTEQIFDFMTVPLFISLFSGSTIEPLYFVQITRKGADRYAVFPRTTSKQFDQEIPGSKNFRRYQSGLS